MRRRGRLGGFGDRDRFTGNAVLVVDPAPQVNQLAVFGTERAIGIILPLDGLVAVWTLHENNLFVAGTGCCQSPEAASDGGRLTRILRLTKSIVPSRRMAFKRTVTLSRVEPTMEAISR